MLLFRVVSTPGVKNVCLSVLFSAVPRSGGQHPRPLGVAPPHRHHAPSSGMQRVVRVKNHLAHTIPYHPIADG